eukprot:CAMPEP_0197914204 /NCGR_PEP_ID=MMETSP1439-20131203/78119_1 /TAXON_ID=66791 /ORGANISM="Gonyaulax spinifera, Strain CCMP409" /LENGTH=58 /DNA_ID=CAMNT_0043536101 /DNA_START=37 /DNA_END=210 /DNA_ORIENTATION=+
MGGVATRGFLAWPPVIARLASACWQQPGCGGVAALDASTQSRAPRTVGAQATFCFLDD